MIAKQSSRENISRVASDRARERPVIEVRVGGNAFVVSVGGELGHHVHAEGAIGGHIVPVLEFCEVQGPGVTSQIQIITCRGGVGFDEVMWTIEAARGSLFMLFCQNTKRAKTQKKKTTTATALYTQNTAEIVQQIFDSRCLSCDWEARWKWYGIPNPDCAHHSEQSGKIDPHTPY